MQGRFLFLAKVATALIVFALMAALFSFITSKLGEGWGLLWAFIAAANLGLGIVLLYWVLVDWVNLRYAKHQAVMDLATADKQIVCLSGRARVSGDPLLTPFTKTECAAYTYSITTRVQKTGDTGTRSQDVAAGFRMLPTTIDTEYGSVTIRALPEFEQGLRENETGKWQNECREFL